MKAIAWTDGSAHNGTHSKGGYGIVIHYFDDENQFIKEVTISEGRYEPTTSAQMEIMAVLKLLIFLNKKDDNVEHIIVHVDNQYVVNTIKLGWLDNWMKLPNFNGKANRGLWERVHAQLREFSPNRFVVKWVKGHNGTFENELADALAKQGSLSKKVKTI